MNSMSKTPGISGRSGSAAKHLAGVMEAQRFVEGKAYEIGTSQAPVRNAPSHEAELLTEALKGERVTIYEINEEGWARGQLAGDGYVGFVPASDHPLPTASDFLNVRGITLQPRPSPSNPL